MASSASSSSSPSHKRARLDQDTPSPNPNANPAMPLNRMHPDNRYRHYTPDFAALAKQYPDSFGPFVRYLDDEQHEAVVDWEDPQAARALTTTLLRHDFGLAWDIPLERLCPPVPNRLNYVCWVRDLLLLGKGEAGLDDATVRGLDIGTGASAIYPLLGARVYGWAFLGTDIDEAALEAARANVARNSLGGRIALKLVPRADYSAVTLTNPAAPSPPGPILAALTNDPTAPETLDFVMCNPPFFGSLDELTVGAHSGGAKEKETAAAKSGPPHACVDEMITPGGELAFVTAMLRDSLQLRARVRWYSSMVGKKATLRKVLALLRGAGVANVRTTEFLQGRTTRWGVGWSFTEDGLAELQGAAAAAHKVFGRKKQAHRREASEQFVVRPTPAVEGEEEGPLDEAAVLKRAVAYFQETRQVNVRRLGLRTGGAEELYRTVLLAELSSEGQPQGPGPVVEGREAVAAAFAPVAPTDPGWRKRCLVVVGAVAGGTAAQEEEGEGMEVDGHGGEGGQGVKVTVEMTSGGDRAAFWKMAGLIPGEVGRTNRRWRRKVGGGGGKKGGGGGGVAESG